MDSKAADDIFSNRKGYRLDDSVIAEIVRLIQLGFLTRTDVVDNFRMIVLEPIDGVLKLTPEYVEKTAQDVEKMFDELETLQAADKA